MKTKDESVSPKAQFEYAWCLIRSKYPADIKKGIILLEELCSTNIEGRRDYIYYLAIGHTRMKVNTIYKNLNLTSFFSKQILQIILF